MGHRFRGWAFTLNNFSEDELVNLRSLELNRQIRYLVFGREVGESGTPHLQGFVYFHNAKYFSQVCNIVGPRCHVENVRGTIAQNVAYCTKDEHYEEFGTVPEQGSRNDIRDTRENFRSGMRLSEVINSATSYQSAKMAELMFKYAPMPPSQKRLIKWYYGPAGCGKTRSACEEAGNDFYITARNLKWWDGYDGQKFIVIDDLRGDFSTYHEFLRIIDRYPFRMEYKGGSLWMQPTTEVIIVTCCYPPDRVWDTIEDKAQLLRRIDEIWVFTGIVEGIVLKTQIK